MGPGHGPVSLASVLVMAVPTRRALRGPAESPQVYVLVAACSARLLRDAGSPGSV